MNVASGRPDDDLPVPNGNVPNGNDASSLLSQEESSLAESSDEEDNETEEKYFSCIVLRKKWRKSLADVKRLNKSLVAKRSYITRLKNQKDDLVSRQATRNLTSKSTLTNLRNTLKQERLTRTQIRQTLRNEYIGEINAAQVLETSCKKELQVAERETTRIRTEMDDLRTVLSGNIHKISTYRQDVVEAHREKVALKDLLKQQDKELKALRLKLSKYDETKTDKQFEIETLRTERARLDVDARKQKNDKKIREIAAVHDSKMGLLQEHARLKSKDKSDREKAKAMAATKKQETDMAKLDSSVSTYHGSSMMSQNGGAFPGGNALLQVRLLLFICL